MQLFDELLEQLHDTALKSVNGEVSVCPQVMLVMQHLVLTCLLLIVKHVDVLTS